MSLHSYFLLLSTFSKEKQLIMKKIFFFSFLFVLLSCGGSDSNGGGETGEGNPDSFNRKEMLAFWADQIIIPAYTDFNSKTNELNNSVQDFTKTPTQSNLTNTRSAWQAAYVSWQKVALFQVGKAQQLNMVGNINTIPTDVDKIKSYAESESYNLESPNLTAVQGLPALDYLLNGLGTDQETIDFYTTATDAAKFKNYLKDITERLNKLTKMVYDDWKGAYRNEFVNNDGYTITSSVDKLVNFYVVDFYEKQFRDPKIGIPAGTKTGIAVPEKVEAFYKKDISKLLYTTSLTAIKNFFQGVSYSGSKGTSLQQYLEFLKRKDLADVINTKFNALEQMSDKLKDNFHGQIQTEKVVFLNTYDAIQAILKSFKPDMMSAMSVMNTSTDTDND
ncbi:Peptidase_M75 domain-containing protein [Tenacibaculum sp. 190524A02b]